MSVSHNDLIRLREWDALDARGNIAFLRSLWNNSYGTIRQTGKRVIRLELHTGGWSENEEIIGYLQRSMLWFIWWMRSERGGHYYFKIRPIARSEKKCKST